MKYKRINWVGYSRTAIPSYGYICFAQGVAVQVTLNLAVHGSLKFVLSFSPRHEKLKKILT
jgi:hypothetical protein